MQFGFDLLVSTDDGQRLLRRCENSLVIECIIESEVTCKLRGTGIVYLHELDNENLLEFVKVGLIPTNGPLEIVLDGEQGELEISTVPSWVEWIYIRGSGDGITALGKNFLGGCTQLKRLDIALLHVTSIAENFLGNCTSLETLDISSLEKVTYIKSGFLVKCSSLTSLDIRKLSQLKEIGNAFLFACTSLTSLTTDNSSNITSVGSAFLLRCSSLTSLDISFLSQVTSIGHGFLYGCTGLLTLDIGPLSRVSSIGNQFLYTCTGLSSLDMRPLSPDTSIGSQFLGGCTVNLSLIADGSQVDLINSLQDFEGADLRWGTESGDVESWRELVQSLG
eukprot:TRINITY_DN28935_c0_g1_i1.p1 TRINITY_DN28935_c0_g1~~TRINITY_DN28935_c0_g1_i1.p1  ORF type:complete len:381 (+),score=-16.25 TRINITY_DN28935_c0_g1_i1:141-1145(+)